MTTTSEDLRTIERMLNGLSEDKFNALLKEPALRQKLQKNWLTNPGPQTVARDCEADELFYGGQAGGGKTDLLLGLAIEDHQRSLLLRRTNKEASRFIRRLSDILGHRDGWSGQYSTYTFDDGRLIEFGGCQLEDDKQKYKGEPKDLIGFDEVSDFTETQYRFIIGWNRSVTPGQRTRVIAAGNPPTTPEGLWVLKYWAAWLDPAHPNPARPGELRWYTTIEGRDTEVDGRGPHDVDGEPIEAKSRTFIPAELDDNPDLSETNYGAVLAALPPGLREAYKEGRFDASIKDDDYQIIPTSWIEAAMHRWAPNGWKAFEMTAMAVDCAGGGEDAAISSYRHGGWFGEMDTLQGAVTADGQAMFNMVSQRRRNNCPVIVDVGGGYAGALIERMKDNGQTATKFNGASSSTAKTIGSNLPFYNKRAEALWKMREALDPSQEGGSVVALPNDTELKADLAAPRYEMTPRGIKAESKEDIKKRIGRSPDKGDSVVMCIAEGDKAVARQLNSRHGRKPQVKLGYANAKRGRR